MRVTSTRLLDDEQGSDVSATGGNVSDISKVFNFKLACGCGALSLSCLLKKQVLMACTRLRGGFIFCNYFKQFVQGLFIATRFSFEDAWNLNRHSAF